MNTLQQLVDFLVSVVAGIVANAVSKWLDGDRDTPGNQPED